MYTAKLHNKLTEQEITVTATTEHPDSSYGQAIWVTENGESVCPVGAEAPWYDVYDEYDDGRTEL